MSGLHWYIVRAVSGQEKKVKASLEKEVQRNNLTDFVTDVLTPTEKVYQIRKMKDGKQKKVPVERSLYSGYVIVQANLSNGEAMHLIKSIPGVLGFLNVDGRDPAERPQPMREAEINRILGKIDETDEFEVKNTTSYIVGETVRVIDGPFSSFTGVIEEVFEEKKKLNVMVKIFNRTTPVELNYTQVEKEGKENG